MTGIPLDNSSAAYRSGDIAGHESKPSTRLVDKSLGTGGIVRMKIYGDFTNIGLRWLFFARDQLVGKKF